MRSHSEWRWCVWAVVLAAWWSPQCAVGQREDLAVPLVSDELRQLLQDRDWPAALQAVDKELQQPDALTERLLFLRGRILYYQAQYDAAVVALREVEQRFPASPWARRARFAAAMALARQDNFQVAGPIYRAEAEALLSPERAAQTADLYLSYAETCFDPADDGVAPDYVTALALYEKALDAGPHPERHLDVAFRVARCHQLLDQLEEAAPQYAAFARAHPGTPQAIEAMFRLGECQLASGDLLHARLTWQELLAAHGADPSPWIAEASYQLSRTWGLPAPGTDEQLLLGVDALRAFLERFPTHERAGAAYLDMAESYICRGRFADAACMLEEFLSDPRQATSAETPRARHRLGYAYLRQERLAEALKVWQEFLTGHPSDAAWSEVQQQVIDTQYLMAAHELEAHQFDPARQLLQEFLAKYPLDPRAPEILWLFGHMSYQQELWEDAIAQWRQLVSKYPETEEASRAHYQLAVVLEQKLGRPREALREYRKILTGSCAGQAREAEARLTTPSMIVSTPRVFRSDEKPYLELTTRNVRSVTLRVYRLNMESYFRKVCLVGDVEQLDIGLIDSEVSQTFEIPDYEDQRELVSHPEISLPGGAARGAVAVTVSSETLEATTLVLQSDLEIIVQAARGDLLVFAENMRTGQPWDGVQLLLSDGQRVFAEATTGDDGVFHAAYDELADCPDVRVAALCDGHVAANLVGLEGTRVTPALPDKGYLYTDRPVYYAGEQVCVRGCIRRAVHGVWAVEAGRPHELEVFDPRARLIWHESIATSPFGTFDTQFPLPATSPPGAYCIQVRDDAGHAYQGTFQVDPSRADPICISVDIPRHVYYRGEEITGTIRVAYRYGAPLVDQLVQYQLVNDRVFTARTNEHGEVPLTLPTRNFFADQVVVLNVQLPDLNIEQQRQLYLAVTGCAVDVTTTRDVFLANEEFEVALATRSAEGQPVGQQLNLEIRRLTKVGDRVTEQIVEDHVVATSDTDGTARVTLQLAAAGQYRLRATGEDRWGNSVGGQRDLLISGDDDRTRLRVLVDDRAWQVGDRADVTLHWREEPALALVTFQTDRVWDYRLVPLQPGPNPLPMELDARLAPRFQLQAVVMVDTRTPPGSATPDAAASAPRLHTASRTFDVTHALQVKLSWSGQGHEGREKNTVTPGQPVEITIRTTDAQGQPVPAEVSLALVEEAARTALPEPPLTAISEFFRPEARPLSVRTGSSIEFAYHPATTPINQPLSADRRRTVTPRNVTVPESSSAKAPSPPPPGLAVPPGTPPGMPPAMPPGIGDAPGCPGSGRNGTAVCDAILSCSKLQESRATRWDTAYWCAAVTTGSTGTATVTVVVPRRLTTWKIVAKGITQGALAGETVETVVADQALCAELKVPEALVPGDETEIIAVVHNQRNEPATVEAHLAVSVAGKTVDQTHGVTVSGKGRQEVRFPIAGSLAGDTSAVPVHCEQVATVRLTLAQGEVLDTVERCVPLQSRGVATRAALSGVAEAGRTVTLDPPAGARRDSLRLRVAVRANVEGSLWEAVMGPPDDAGHRRGTVAMTDSLSSDLLATLGIQQLLQLPVTSEDPRARQVVARTRVTIAELVSAQLDDGAWGWSLGAGTSDRYATARVVWALSLARRAGHRVPDACLQQATQYLTAQLAVTAPDDPESKAVLLHALSAAGQPDFSLANRLQRERAQLSTPALLYLALAFVEMERLPLAAELLSICEQRMGDATSGTAPAPPTPLAAQTARGEWLALRALALASTAPEATESGAVIDQVLAQRPGLRWTPDRATGPAVLALGRWFTRHRPSGENRAIKVSINDQPAQVFELPADLGAHVVEFPADQLVEGEQRVVFEPAGPGRYVYDVVLSGVLDADQLRNTTQAWQVTRSYAPAPRELSGRPLPRGFDNVRDTTKAFANPLTQLPAGERGEVELQIKRHVPDETPVEMLDYLIVTEPIPSGVMVLADTIRGPHERVEIAPGRMTFYLGKAREFAAIRYDVSGEFAGESQAGATLVWNAYRQEEQAVAEPRRLRVLPPGTPSADPYRWTPQELYELGSHAYQQRDWPRAEALLSQLLADWSLQPAVYRDTVEMLLDVAIELQKPDQVVRYFEIIFEQWPDKEIVLDKVMRIGAAYQELGEAERSFQVFRAAVEGAFTREGGVAGVLLGIGKRLPSARIMQRLLCEYPPEPYVATAHLALAQQIATWAPEAARDPLLRAAGVRAADLIDAAWRMQEDYLVEYPLAPTADQAAFAAASALLEAKDFARAAVAAQRYAVRYPDSELLDDFSFLAGYCRFTLGEPELAIELLRHVATGQFLDETSGQLKDSDNKWSAIYVLGQIYHSLGRVVEALQEYRLVEDRFPDAKASIGDLLREVMRLPELTTVRPGQPVEIELVHRNVVTCELKVYRIDLEKFAVLRRTLAGIRDINLAGIEPYRETSVALGEGQDYRDLHRMLPLEVTEEGAYLIVCRGGSQFASGLLLVTSLDLEVSRDPHASSVRVTLRDVTSDQYVHGADVKVIGAGKADLVAGQTDRRGLFVAESVVGSPTVIAHAGAGKYALYRSADSLPAMAVGVPSGLVPRGMSDAQQVAGRLSPDAAEALEATGTILAGPGISPGDQRILAILDTPTALTCEETPLQDVAHMIMQQHNFTVLIDRRALEDVGLSDDTPVTFDVSDMNLGAALKLMLRQLDLTYLVQYEALHITTPEEADNELTTVAYPVTDLIRYRAPDGTSWSDFDTLIFTITSTISPDTWDEVGGAGAIEATPIQDTDVLVISQTQDTQREIASALQRLRAIARQDRPEGEVPVKERPDYPGGDALPGAGGLGDVQRMGGMGGVLDGMGATFGGAGAVEGDNLMHAPGLEDGRDARARGSATPDGPELLRGLEQTKRRLQGQQVDELQRLYEQGKRGSGGGVGAGGFF